MSFVVFRIQQNLMHHYLGLEGLDSLIRFRFSCMEPYVKNLSSLFSTSHKNMNEPNGRNLAPFAPHIVVG